MRECDQCVAEAVLFIKQPDNPRGGLSMCMQHLGELMDRSRDEILSSRSLIAELEAEVERLKAENLHLQNLFDPCAEIRLQNEAYARGLDDAQKTTDQIEAEADDFYARLDAELSESFPAEGEACDRKLADLRAKLESE